MRIVRYSPKDDAGVVECGALVDGKVHRLNGDPLGGPAIGQEVAPVAEVELLVPCVPTKVLAAAMNYYGKSDRDPNMTEPLIFLKSPTSLCGPEDDILSPFLTKRHWGEPEVAVVMKRKLYRPSRDEIPAAILGYTSANDVTAENVDGLNHHLARSKAANTFCPVGAYIDTDFDYRDKKLSGWHEGHLLFSGNTSDFFWDPLELVYRVSQYISLEPWDIVLTGSPALTGELTFLQSGETFTVEIEGLPVLKNRLQFSRSRD